MALVMMCGIPAAGKTRRAHEIADFFRLRLSDCHINEVHIIDDESLGIKKSDYYDRETEKRARGKQMSAVKRLIGPNSLVILDNMTYIKGFRYQLYCEAKAVQVISCVVYIGNNSERAKDFNQSTGTTALRRTPWPQDLFDQLVFRFEEPNGMTRWDSPLFIVIPDEELPVNDIWDAIVNKQPPKPNAATHKDGPVATDYLTLLNNTIAQISKEALDLFARSPGAQVTLHGKPVQLPYSLTMPQLARIRRNFVFVNKQTPMPLENIVSYFVEFLEKNWHVVS